MSWYYAVNGQQAGPVEDAELQQLLASGALTPATLVWRPGMENWAPFSSLAPAVPTETCAHCRRAVAASLTLPLAAGPICPACKPLVLQRVREGLAPLPSATRFAGFWIRFVARLIDNTITSIGGYVFQIPLLVVVARAEKGGPNELSLILGLGALAVVMSLAVAGYYEAWFITRKGATPGKMILGLKVVRARGGRIGWGLATGRFFAYMLSGLTLYVGYLMAAWDEEKRSLHDRICDTRVVSGS